MTGLIPVRAHTRRRTGLGVVPPRQEAYSPRAHLAALWRARRGLEDRAARLPLPERVRWFEDVAADGQWSDVVREAAGSCARTARALEAKNRAAADAAGDDTTKGSR